MSDPEEMTFHNVIVTCETEECGNAGVPIPLLVPDEPAEPNVVCGVCGAPITSVETPAPEVEPT